MPTEQRIVTFDSLGSADLVVDALYKGGQLKNAGDDPISKLVSTGNQGGFRALGSVVRDSVRLCVLYSSLEESDWPDFLDHETGRFVYYGDNRKPGHELHQTNSKGNEMLRMAFDRLHSDERIKVPPFFIFTKAGEGRDVMFRGLAAPGSVGLNFQEDLIAVWRSKDGRRFQNYRAVFTMLDESTISRQWIQHLITGHPADHEVPDAWKEWVETGKYRPLTAPRVLEYRTIQEQLPTAGLEVAIVATVVQYFKNHPRKEFAFEECACELAVLMDPNIVEYSVTRPWRDGGRDAVGLYRIGHLDNAVKVEFALEAKCKVQTSGSTIRETTRLLSRLRHRQFGIFVTTSYVALQAYKEIVEDKQPIVILAGHDIARILIRSGYDTPKKVSDWLTQNFPYVP